MVASHASHTFDAMWVVAGGPVKLVSADAVMLELNAWIRFGYPLLVEIDVARRIRAHELDGTVYDALLELDSLAA